MLKIVADQNIPFVKECFSSLGDVQTCSGRQITPELVRDADILLVRSITPVNEALLAGSRVRFVGTATIGTDHVDTEYLRRAKIAFASAPGSNANSVAEYVVAGLLLVAKRRQWTLEGKSIGIIGVGNVGSRVEAKCRALGMIPVLNDPPLARITADSKYRPLEEALACDIVTLHTPLTEEGPDATFHLADDIFFSVLKKGAVFLNTARGAVMETAALKQAIESGKTAAVILDVWENEPTPDPWLIRRVDISTPHIAGYSFDGKVNGLLMIYRAACEFLGVPPQHTEKDFLPPPAVPRIEISSEQVQSSSEEILLHEIIQQVYPIGRDDFNMREILQVPADQQGAFFDRLRKEYPVRREFQNTVVKLPKGADTLAAKLAGIGFQVEMEQSRWTLFRR
jgi:erythronate-4-phosphate dehydrogenase